jgi:hypothetical protein
MLNNATMRVEWDESSRKETEDAKSHFVKAKRELRLIVDENETKVEHFAQVVNKGFFQIKDKALLPTQVALRISNELGDDTVTWDSRDPDELEQAEDKFNAYLKKGWRAFAIDPEGNKHRRIRSFNASLQEVTFQEGPNIKMAISKFVEKFKKVELMPKTRAG